MLKQLLCKLLKDFASSVVTDMSNMCPMYVSKIESIDIYRLYYIYFMFMDNFRGATTRAHTR